MSMVNATETKTKTKIIKNSKIKNTKPLELLEEIQTIEENQIPNKIVYVYRILVVQNTGKDLFDYQSTNIFDMGQIVEVPFGKKTLIGMVHSKPETYYEGVKKFIENIYPVLLHKQNIEFIEKIGDYHLVEQNQFLGKMLYKIPKRIKQDSISHIPKTVLQNSELTDEQQQVFNSIQDGLSTFNVSLLFGITGSGKSEIYFHLIHEVLNKGGQILFLLPEIGIVSGMEQRIKDKLNIDPLLWFAGGKTTNCWKKVYNGDPVLVLGARSGLFLPFKNLKLIIVDEEHDGSYNEENHPCYQGRNMAILLGQIWKCPVVLGSATPSTESYYRAQQGLYKLYYLKNRYGKGLLPKVHLIQDQISIISKTCIQEIKKVLEEKKQVLVYLNKRGFSPLLECLTCQEKQNCKNCDQLLVLHQLQKTMQCHLCGCKYPQNICVVCGEKGILTKGYGVERLEVVLKKHFPEYKMEIFSSDFCNSREKIHNFIERIRNREIDLIIGTQIIAKGHNFPGLSLVVIINTFLQSGDFRGKEILIQNLLQVSGRAGRYEEDSRVLVQSNDNNIRHLLQESEYEKFLIESVKERERWDLPPFARLAMIRGEDKNLTLLERKMNDAYKGIKQYIDSKNIGITIFSPANNPIGKIRNKYRMFILLKTHKASFRVIKDVIKKQKLYLHINPYDFY